MQVTHFRHLLFISLALVACLFGCIASTTLFTIVPPDNKCTILLSQSWKYEKKEFFYGATTPQQIQMLTDSLPCKLYHGYWEGPNWTGLMTICNHRITQYMPRQIIRWENDSFLRRNLTLFKRYYTKTGKTQLMQWCDSLDKKQFPYYVIEDIRADSMVQRISIHYLFPYKNPTIKKFDQSAYKTQDSITTIMKQMLPQKKLSVRWATSAYKENKVVFEIDISTDTLVEFAPYISLLQKKLPGITNWQSDSLNPAVYTLIYFVPQS